MAADQRQQLQCGRFLQEAAAFQRANAGGSRYLARIAFPSAEAANGAPLVLVTTVSPKPAAPVLLPATATRHDIHVALAREGGWALPDPRPLTRFPVTGEAPPLVVYADLLEDIGSLLFTLTGYPSDVGRPDVVARLDAIGLIGATTAVVEVSALGAVHRVNIPLDSGVPLVAVPLEIAEHLLTVQPSVDGAPAVEWEYPVGRS
ncbi:hypothetical protein AB0A71_30830 [Kitasatospora aureofaciens]|uniref:hypothetical protein n=1 Tax=Kitasatospora aureofaciens TaxID=1894 RepID=UPI0033DBD538